ncbi:hypothetical protein B0H34DRAFT_677755 [Crassisporium funariophilum]|nr:hypothetical protein B0H34DRAFT_677755 [Crassisporium funariophilum]
MWDRDEAFALLHLWTPRKITIDHKSLGRLRSLSRVTKRLKRVVHKIPQQPDWSFMRIVVRSKDYYEPGCVASEERNALKEHRMTDWKRVDNEEVSRGEFLGKDTSTFHISDGDDSVFVGCKTVWVYRKTCSHEKGIGHGTEMAYTGMFAIEVFSDDKMKW